MKCVVLSFEDFLKDFCDVYERGSVWNSSYIISGSSEFWVINVFMSEAATRGVLYKKVFLEIY